MRKRMIFKSIPIFLTLIACGSGMTGIESSEFQKIDPNFSGTFKNRSYKNIRPNNGGHDLKIIDLFGLKSKHADSINLSFTNDHSLVVKFNDSTGVRTEQFNGKFSRRGFYEIYLKKKNIEIPPLLPLLYCEYDTNRIRISFTPDNDLLIDNHVAFGGSILVLGNGGSYNALYYFERVKE
ncbi:hypothetical protein ACFQ1M_04620 [Sungkyunkwania multivorans]|uniref:Lipoprotein n=1 Tax=Sungkyunkwania multivorans TaxID=1173618 RepID=A0ABW3CUN6_9FLAO